MKDTLFWVVKGLKATLIEEEYTAQSWASVMTMIQNTDLILSNSLVPEGVLENTLTVLLMMVNRLVKV